VSSPDARAAPSPPPAVLCERVSKIYPAARPVVALDAIDLAVRAGEFLAVVGPSGGGKSTLLHVVAGIDRATSGSVRVGGRDLATLSERDLTLYRRREVGVVYQFFNLLPHLTVRENVELPRLLDGKRDAAARAEELLRRVDLESRRDAYPGELSGGEMQRAAIARSPARDSCSPMSPPETSTRGTAPTCWRSWTRCDGNAESRSSWRRTRKPQRGARTGRSSSPTES
jgi:putative ABC transport system ATP-binding protein